jgi:hypothetical protein
VISSQGAFGMDLEIGLTTKIDGLSLEEIVFRGDCAPDDRAAFEDLRGLLEALLMAHDPDAVLLNLMGVDRFLADDLHELARITHGADRPRGPRLCSVAVRMSWTLVSADGTPVHRFDAPGVAMCALERDAALAVLKVYVDDKAAEPPGQWPVYFPDGALAEPPLEYNFRARWFSKHLWRMGEPSLSDLSRDPACHAYRFLLLPAFDRPICVRLDIGPAATGLLTYKELSGQGGNFPGRLIIDRSSVLPSREVRTFLGRLEKADFWRAEFIEERGLDGAEWILEGARDGRYRVAHLWSPTEGAFREAALFLIELSGVPVGKIY